MLVRMPILAVVLLTASAAHAQWYADNRASTVGESHARGVSDIIRARSHAAINYSEAAIGATEARSRQLDNRLKSTQTFFEMRRINREERFGTPDEKYELKQRNEQRFARRARKGNPNELSDAQLDPLTGKIGWPLPLMSPDYEEYRTRLDALFEERARNGGKLSYKTSEQMNKATDKFLVALKKDIHTMGAKNYLASKRFVGALAYQAKNNSG